MALSIPAASAAQAPGDVDAPRDGGFPEATFEAAFEKYVSPETPFSPFYSWDAQMWLDVAVFRRGAATVNFTGTFQTIGTENLGSKVGVGGTGYLLGLDHARVISNRFTLRGGFRHLSSHLTRDLDDKVDEQRGEGESIPLVQDPSEYNVIWVGLSKTVSTWPFAPELQVIVTPINFLFTGEDAGYVRPLYVRTRLTLWERNGAFLVARTEHEIGHNAFNRFSLLWELFATDEQEGRFQVFVAATPGDDFHISPHVGGVRDGVAFGVRMRFRS